MKLLTLNCHSWQEEEQVEKIKILAKVIKEEQYDVIALQEVSQLIKNEILYDNIKVDNYVELLLKELKKYGINNYNYIWDFAHVGYHVYEEGIAILTRHTIKSYNSFYVSRDTDVSNHKSRKVLKVTICIEDNDHDFYSCHLGWWNDREEPFKEQVDNLFKALSNKRNSFLMGDFNNDAMIKGEGYDYLMSLGLIDTYNIAFEKDIGITVSGEIDGWENSQEDKRIDLILCKNEVNVLSSKVRFNTKDYVVSDHFGVEVNVK